MPAIRTPRPSRSSSLFSDAHPKPKARRPRSHDRPLIKFKAPFPYKGTLAHWPLLSFTERLYTPTCETIGRPRPTTLTMVLSLRLRTMPTEIRQMIARYVVDAATGKAAPIVRFYLQAHGLISPVKIITQPFFSRSFVTDVHSENWRAHALYLYTPWGEGEDKTVGHIVYRKIVTTIYLKGTEWIFGSGCRDVTYAEGPINATSTDLSGIWKKREDVGDDEVVMPSDWSGKENAHWVEIELDIDNPVTYPHHYYFPPVFLDEDDDRDDTDYFERLF